MPFSSFWSDLKGQSGADEVDQIFGKRVFAFPKALEVIHQILDFATDKDSIVMDSFAGSATTAHAVLGLNNEDGGKRRFVLVECEDYADSITAERVRRVANGLPAAKDEALKAGLGGTFSYFKLGRALQLKAILEGKSLPDFESLARYVFFTATGEEFNANQIDRATGFIGASRHHDVFLLYTEDAGQLKQLALTLDAARALPSVSGKPKLVFAPTKYLDDSFLDRLRITFCQLPFQIYKALEA
jgi:adenine-specific DNA-methyltransferase